MQLEGRAKGHTYGTQQQSSAPVPSKSPLVNSRKVFEPHLQPGSGAPPFKGQNNPNSISVVQHAQAEAVKGQGHAKSGSQGAHGFTANFAANANSQRI